MIQDQWWIGYRIAALQHPPEPLPESHPFYALVGRVAAEWAEIEHILDLIIWDLSGVDRKLGSCITGQLLGQYGRFNAVHALAAAKGFEQGTLNRIEHLRNTAGNLATRRNRFVHDAWHTTGGGQASQFKSFSAKDGKFGFHDVSSDYAVETIRLIQEKAAEVSQLRLELTKSPPGGSEPAPPG
jgi:hypothetical protein